MAPVRKRPPADRVLKQTELEGLREDPRALVAQPAVGWWGNKGERHWVRIVDISQSGMRLLDLESMPELGSTFQIFWRLMAGLPEVPLRGRVVWTNRQSCGLRFVKLGKKEKHLLRQFVTFHRSEVNLKPTSSK